jgi:ligand-binding sensor domain-containing protein
MYGFSYYADDNLFIIDRDRGISILTGEGPAEVLPEPSFFRENEIAFIINRDLNSYLLGTTNNGIFVFDGATLTPWDAGINERLKREQIYTGLKLNNQQMAIGTTWNGLYIINFQGEIISHVNRLKGLQNNTVLSLFQDVFDNLWLGLDNGIDALEISLPITEITYAYGIETAYTSRVYNGILYIGTNQGLFARPIDRIQNRYTNGEEFRPVEGVVGQVWSLEELNGKLVCGNNLGTFIVEGYTSHQVSGRMGGWTYVQVPGRKDRMIGGTYTGLQLYGYDEGSPYGWEEIGTLEGFNESCKEMAFDENGHVWITHEYKGIFRLELSEDLRSIDSITLYRESAGLPGLPYRVSKLKGELVVCTLDGLYSYNHIRDTFLLNEEFNELLEGETGLAKVMEDAENDIWFFTRENMGVLRRQEDGSYTKIKTPFSRIQSEFLGSTYENVFVYDRQNVFIGGERGMLHYDPSREKEFGHPFHVYIGEVILHRKLKDSIIFFQETIAGTYEVPHTYNSLSFRFFAPYYEAPGHISYSYILKGFDEVWSDWSAVNIKEYTNLHEGDYEFMVRARNVYGSMSETSSFSFTVAPPFYRTSLAFSIYAVFILLTVLAIIVLFRRRITQTRDIEKARHAEELRLKEEFYLEGVKLSEQEIERLKKEKLLIEMRHKDMELANSTMYLVQKNKFLNRIKSEMQELIGKLTIESNKHSLRQIVNRIDRDIKSKQHWKVFDEYFDEVHEDFLKRLKEKHPVLTPKDLRMCAYLKMNLSTKEIAPLMNISVRGVEISRYRLRKKMDIGPGKNLTEYILEV